MAYTLKINAVDKTSLWLRPSTVIEKGADDKNYAEFQLIAKATDLGASDGLIAGQDVKIYEDTTLIFGGVVKEFKMDNYEPGIGSDKKLLVSVSCKDYNDIPSRRVTSSYFTTTTAGAIVTAMVDDVLGLTGYDEGITAGTISAGATIDIYSVNAKTAKEVLDDMAEASGFKWYINNAKELNFIEDDTVTAAAHELLETAPTFTDFNITRVSISLENYRNKQWVTGSVDSTGTLVNVAVEDAVEITARAGIEGGSGVYGNVISSDESQDSTDAEAVGDNAIKRYGTIPYVIEFESGTNDWVAGTKLKVNVPSMGINTDTYFLIENVTLEDVGTVFRSVITATRRDGTEFSTQRSEGSIEYFAKMAKKASAASSTVGDVEVQTLEVANETAYTAFTTEQVLDSIDVDFKEDTIMNFQVRTDLTASETSAYTVKLRVDGVAEKTTVWYMADTNKDGRMFNGAITGIAAGTKTVDVTVTPVSGNGTIAIDEYQLTLIIADSVVEPVESGASDGYVLGGENSVGTKVLTNDGFNPELNAWTNKTDLPSPAREEFPTVNISGKGYTFGGNDLGGGIQDNDEYDSSGNSWANKTDLPSPARYAAGGFAIDDKGYILGGYTSYLSDNDEYNPIGNSWANKTDIPSPARRYLQGAYADTKGYIMGGRAASTDYRYGLSDNDEYDASGDSWAAKANMLLGMQHPGMASMSGKVYVFGGYGAVAAQTRTDEYDPSGNSWTNKTPMPSPARYASACFSVKDKGYSSGGYKNLSDTDEYNPTGNSWTSKANTLASREYASGVAL